MSDMATKPIHTTQRVHSFFREFDSETFQDSIRECEEIFSQWLNSLSEYEISQECDEVADGITCCLEGYVINLFTYLHGTRVILSEPNDSEPRKKLFQRLHDRGIDIDIHSLHDDFIAQAHTKAEYAISLLDTALTFDIFAVPQHYKTLIAHLNELVTDATSPQNEEARAAYLSSIYRFHSFVLQLAMTKKLEAKDARIQCLETEKHGLIEFAKYFKDQFQEIQSKQNSKPSDPDHSGHSICGDVVTWNGKKTRMTSHERRIITQCHQSVEEGDGYNYITFLEIFDECGLTGKNPYPSQIFRKDKKRAKAGELKLYNLFFSKVSGTEGDCCGVDGGV